MALLPYPSDIQNRLELVVNGYINKQTGLIPQSLSDGNVTDSTSSMYWFNDTVQYLDVTFDRKVNIWRYPLENTANTYIGALKILIWNGTSFVDYPQVENTPTVELKWTKIFSEIPKGRYKFIWKSGTYRADAEWFIETVRLNKILISLDDGSYKKWVNANVVATPVMTSNTTPSGRAFALNKFDSNNEPYMAFNGVDDSTGYNSLAGSGGIGYLGYEFPSPKTIWKYKIRSGTNAATTTRQPRDWTFEGSNDGGANWTVLDTQVGHSWTILKDKIFIVQNNEQFKMYRINWTSNNGATQTSVNEFTMYGDSLPPQSWITVVTSKPPTEQDFLNSGMDKIDIESISELAWRELDGHSIKILEYTDNPSQTESVVETVTEPYSIYDEFGDTMEVLYYTDDPTKTSAKLEIAANYSPLDEIDGDFEVVTWTDTLEEASETHAPSFNSDIEGGSVYATEVDLTDVIKIK